jgi:hypothetical protein
VHRFGAHGFGGRPLDGRIVELAAFATPQEVALSWGHERAAAGDHRLAVVLDGDAAVVGPAGTVEASLVGLADGQHTVDVRVLRGDVRRLPDFHGRAYGRRAHLLWPAATSVDCTGYRIYWDAGTGTVDLDEPLAATSGTFVEAIIQEGPTSGSGTGRASIFGTWTGAAANRELTVRIDGAGLWSHDLSGSFGASRAFAAGGTYNVGNGVVVRFDSAGGYQTGDEWTVRIGPPTSWTSGELVEGTYRFRVAAVDAAGNGATPLAQRSVVIVHRPNEVTAARAVKLANGDIALSWTLPADGDIDAVLILSNWSNAMARLRPRLIERGAWVTKAADATSHTFTPPAAGVWKFRVLVRDTAGRLSESLAIASVDTAAPATSTRLSVPELLDVTPTAGGTFRVRWQYNWGYGDGIDEGQDATRFIVYAHDSASGSFAVPEEVIAVSPSVGIVEYSFDTPDYPAARWFTVRAGTATEETSNTDSIMGIPDAAAPSHSGTLRGVAN